MKLGCQRKSHKGREALGTYVNQQTYPLRPLCQRPNFMSTYRGLTPV